jgi:hypothetical protein
MAKLGTKQRPAIVRVQTEARAKEVASVFNEHGWQFILGIEPDKPENISDLKRLLKSQQVPKARKVGAQTTSRKTRKSHSRRKNNPPLRTVRTGSKRKELSTVSRKVNEERCEYLVKTNIAILPAIITGTLSAFLLVKLLTTASLWYLILLILPFLFFLLCMNILVLNQRVILQGHTLMILRRTKKPLTVNVADALYQITMRRGDMYKFRFHFDNGQRVADITPAVYKDGDKLLQQFKTIIDQEKIVVDIIERERTSEQPTMVKHLQRWKMAQTIKKHRDNKSLVMGVTWYRPEQWERLREIVEDKENFDKTYEESRLDSENQIKQLESQGLRPVKVEVDVEEMIKWCSDQGLSVTPETRTKYTITKLRELVKNGTVKP